MYKRHITIVIDGPYQNCQLLPESREDAMVWTHLMYNKVVPHT